MNEELRAMFEADQSDRRDRPAYDTPAHWEMCRHDAERRRRVSELLAEEKVTTADDYFHAALIFQHGETLDDIWQAPTSWLNRQRSWEPAYPWSFGRTVAGLPQLPWIAGSCTRGSRKSTALSSFPTANDIASLGS